VLGPCVGVHDADYSVSARRTTLRATRAGARRGQDSGVP
jgi:hypothetical protein